MTDEPRHAPADRSAEDALRDALVDAMTAHEEQRRGGEYPHLGQDNDIRRFAEWVANWIELRGQWLTDEYAEATNAAMNYGQGQAEATPSRGPDLREAWAEVEQALIAAQGDADGFGLEVGYWSEFPERPWHIRYLSESDSFSAEADGTTLLVALQYLALALNERVALHPK